LFHLIFPAEFFILHEQAYSLKYKREPLQSIDFEDPDPHHKASSKISDVSEDIQT